MTTIASPKKNGGPRPGAGRPRNPVAPALTERQVAAVAACGATAAEMARAHMARAVAVLLHVAEQGLNEPARVSAARALIAIAKDAEPPAPVSAEAATWAELLKN